MILLEDYIRNGRDPNPIMREANLQMMIAEIAGLRDALAKFESERCTPCPGDAPPDPTKIDKLGGVW